MDMQYIKKDKGKVISLWCPVHRQGCVSTNTAFLTSLFSLMAKDGRILVLSNDTMYNVQGILSDEINDGLSFLYTLASTGNLKKEEDFSVYTKNINLNLELLGNSFKEELVINNLSKEINVIIEKAKDIYDFIFVDVAAGTRNKTSINILKNSDFILFNLPQDFNIINRFSLEDEKLYLPFFKEKETLINISNYINYKHFPKRKIEKILKQKVSIISNNEFVHKAIMDKDVLGFLEDEIKYGDKKDIEILSELEYIYGKIIDSIGGAYDE